MTLPIVERLRADAQTIVEIAQRDEPTLSPFGCSALYGSLSQAADTIEELVEFVRRASRGSGQIAIVADELLAKIGEAR